MSKWKPQNIRLMNIHDSNEKGVTYPETGQTWITANRHVSLDDLIISSIEESIHEALYMAIKDSINIEQEELLVQNIFWALNDWILVD